MSRWQFSSEDRRGRCRLKPVHEVQSKIIQIWIEITFQVDTITCLPSLAKHKCPHLCRPHALIFAACLTLLNLHRVSNNCLLYQVSRTTTFHQYSSAAHAMYSECSCEFWQIWLPVTEPGAKLLGLYLFG